jgi:molybdopterin converting factor small subunit
MRYLWKSMSTTTSDQSMSILLFASYSDAFGTRRLPVPVAAPCRVSDVVEAMRRLPGGAVLPAKPLVAVNRVWVDLDAIIEPGAEVALIPPVAGG